MNYFRYWLSAQLIEWGVRTLPDEYTRSRMALGMQWAADLINSELRIEDEHDGQMELGLEDSRRQQDMAGREDMAREDK